MPVSGPLCQTRKAWLSLCLLVAVLTSACTAGSPGTGPAASQVSLSPGAPGSRISGWLHTSGQVILDSRNRPVRLLGVSVQGMGKGQGLPSGNSQGIKGYSIPSGGTYPNISSWGFNSIRLPIAWADIEPTPPTVASDGSVTHHYNEPYLSAVDGIVHAFGQRGIAVILCMCQHKWSPSMQFKDAKGDPVPASGMPTWLYPPSTYNHVYQAKRDFFANVNHTWDWFTEAWKKVAARYADNPTVVGVDVLNEPYWGTSYLPSPDLLHLDELYKQVGTGIRSVNPHVLLIFEDSQDNGSGTFGLHGPPPFPNVVYSFHLYTDNWQPEGLTRTQDYMARATQWHLPLWIGEFNRFGKATGKSAPPDWTQQLAQMLTYTRGHDISWAYWGYNGTDPLADPSDQLANPELLRLLQAGF